MNIKQSLLKTSEKLKKHHIENSTQEAEMLLVFVLKKPKEFLHTHGEHKLNLFQLLHLQRLTRKRLKGYSLAVVVGEKEFYGYKFKVNKHVLVPRPETEMFIDLITHNPKLITQKNDTVFIDIGTGTGCIPITIIKELKKNNQLKILNLKFLASDISKKALKVAKQNAKLNNVEKEIKFYQGNLLEPITNDVKHFDSNLVITANLPYLSPKQVNDSPSIQKEPILALVADDDGLKYYKELFKQIKTFNHKNLTIFCEIDPSQTKDISELIKIALPDFKFKIKKDLRGLERLLVLNV